MVVEKWSEADVPAQDGRVAVITGANTGIGFETARVLAERGATVVLAVRDTEKGEDAAARIAATVPRAKVSVRELDLASLASVRAAAERLRAEHARIDLLVNNAGVMYTPKATTRDGFELQFGTNHLGHFALTGLLLDRLLPVPGSRVVTVSSMAHRFRSEIDFEDPRAERSYDRISAYGRSKLANLLFTRELQTRLADRKADTVATAAHPGLSATELMRHLPGPLNDSMKRFGSLVAQSPAMGALPTLRAATDPRARGGSYYGPDGFMETRGYPVPVKVDARARDTAAQRRLWTLSEDLTGVTFPV
ncbi:SDR family NAD(P)-dependent oxidoreductase [Streptomyces alkaliphilus]|uniref:SDR family NAD(P)-dependent oxidoreductase n=1 Tax=Streptomyces alkaliphilus TaxID=1472722 RepID=A0A7W3Y148_9ACTN|nr:SDR family NAD(P)-dependent oxidoreductase [Streptomyces alkaliphilus]MBB0243895.1 SDR family NAD(P)-dependent oxidoreductase [Streptomyces alkaliphilus]